MTTPEKPTEPEERAPEPWYEAEDCGCACMEDWPPSESQWEWSPDEGCYICQGCGESQ